MKSGKPRRIFALKKGKIDWGVIEPPAKGHGRFVIYKSLIAENDPPKIGRLFAVKTDIGVYEYKILTPDGTLEEILGHVITIVRHVRALWLILKAFFGIGSTSTQVRRLRRLERGL